MSENLLHMYSFMKSKTPRVTMISIFTKSIRTKKNLLNGLLTSCLVLVSSVTGRAAISFDGSIYTEDFNSLAISGTANSWNNNSTIGGWHLFSFQNASITSYRASNGSGADGAFYSFGTTASTDRALGGVGSGGAYFGSPSTGTLAGYIAVALKNDSTAAFEKFTVSFSGEQWRNGGNATAQTMVLEYGFGTSFTDVSSWITPGGTFNFTSPVASSTAAAVDGNAAGSVSGLGGTISGLNWGIAETLWIRWREVNDVGNDHGLAIDDFSITAASTLAVVPEPSTFIAGALLALPFGAHGIRYLRHRKRA
jgi:hypothetical protein